MQKLKVRRDNLLVKRAFYMHIVGPVGKQT